MEVSQSSTSSSSSQETEISGRNTQPLIPGLPDEIGELCLLHVPYPYQALAVCPQAFACTSLPRQGKLFVLGGMRSDTETPMQSTIMYRATTNQWRLASPMLTPRSFFASGNVNGKIMAVGGTGANINETMTAVECYDPESDTWTTAAKLRMGLARYDSAVMGSKMYVTEGWTWPFMFSPRGGVYDINKDTWNLMSDGMKEGWTGISIVLEGKLFVISEHGDCPMKQYNPDDDTWRYVGGDKFPCEVMHRPFAVNGVEGKIYVVSSGLNVAIGRVYEEQNGGISAEWKVMTAPRAFKDLAPSSCQVVYA
ncbi:F-box protein AFR [Citrus sinensis]|nr:F-box protein AFR [Citrus sinensis]